MTDPTMTRPEDCPEPFWHETHRYCPCCTWVEPTTAQVQIKAEMVLLRDVLEALCQQRGVSLDSESDPGSPARNYELMDRLGIGHIL